MNIKMKICLRKVLERMNEYFEEQLVPFWSERCIDRKNGGYLVDFDKDGIFKNTDEKYLVTQTRVLYGLSLFCKYFKNDAKYKKYAECGYNFLAKYFWDYKNYGWIWKTDNKGTSLDRGKVVYGQSFALYALCEYYLISGNKEILAFAEKTFELLQIHCSDNLYGGYYENFTENWELEEPGYAGGDRKSLDVHMHLLEAYTKLYECTKKELHRRKLLETIELIFDRMVHKKYFCGLNQFNIKFENIPPIAIKRTWNADRKTDTAKVKDIDGIRTTSYGHNLELVWLTLKAFEILKIKPSRYTPILEELANHSIRYGLDRKYGGMFRDGPYNGKAMVLDKEWWQQSESLVGALYSYELTHDDKFLDAFINIWEFVDSKMINKKAGEWYPLLDRAGGIKLSDLGNPWKASYHTGRSMVECINKLTKILNNGTGRADAQMRGGGIQ